MEFAINELPEYAIIEIKIASKNVWKFWTRLLIKFYRSGKLQLFMFIVVTCM